MDFAAQTVLDFSPIESSYIAPLPASSGRAGDLNVVARSRFARVLPEPISVPVEGINREITVKIASTADEWEQAFRLVAQRYSEKGYVSSGEDDLHFTLFHALPDTVTFVAKEGEQVLTTMSLVPDNHVLGLPMESIYAEEIDALRLQGKRLNEVTCLADSDLPLRQFVPVFMTMSRLLLQYNASQGSNELVIEVNPRHVKFYQKVWGFVPIGPQRSCPLVQGAPAEAFFMDIHLMRDNAPKTYEFAYGTPVPTEALASRAMPAHLVRRFAYRSCRTDRAAAENILDHVDQFGSARRW